MEIAFEVVNSLIEVFRILVTCLGSIALPLVILFISKQATDALKKRELSTKYVELALSILTEEPTEENQELRQWAIKTLNLHADIKLPEKSREGLVLKYQLKTGAKLVKMLEEIDERNRLMHGDATMDALNQLSEDEMQND